MLEQIIQVCLIPLLGILTKYIVDFLEAKRAESKVKIDNETAKKYIDMITDTVKSCVIATNQTYVENLKKDNAFNKECQKEAFTKTMDAILKILNEDIKEYIVKATGDLSTYLTQLIEAQINALK